MLPFERQFVSFRPSLFIARVLALEKALWVEVGVSSLNLIHQVIIQILIF